MSCIAIFFGHIIHVETSSSQLSAVLQNIANRTISLGQTFCRQGGALVVIWDQKVWNGWKKAQLAASTMLFGRNSSRWILLVFYAGARSESESDSDIRLQDSIFASQPFLIFWHLLTGHGEAREFWWLFFGTGKWNASSAMLRRQQRSLYQHSWGPSCDLSFAYVQNCFSHRCTFCYWMSTGMYQTATAPALQVEFTCKICVLERVSVMQHILMKLVLFTISSASLPPVSPSCLP